MLAVDGGFATVMKQVGTACLFDAGTDARALALNVLPEDDSALQWSRTGSGLTVDLDRTFERLYERYVTRYDCAPTGDTEADETQLGGESGDGSDDDASQGGGQRSGGSSFLYLSFCVGTLGALGSGDCLCWGRWR